MRELAAAILNGGRATRMAGADKAALEVAGRRIVDRQLEVLRQRCRAIAMVGAEPAAARLPGLARVGDRVGGLGPVDGIAGALAWSPEDWLLVVASDMPFPSLALLDLLLEARSEEANVVGTAAGGRAQPLFALYRRSALPVLDRCLAQGRLRASALLCEPPEGLIPVLLAESEVRAVDPRLRSFQNLNSPQDLLTSEASIE